MNIFSFKSSIYFLWISEDSPLNFPVEEFILFNLLKRIVSYDRANMKKVGNFYAAITIKYVLHFYYKIYLTSQGHVKNLIAHH